VVNIVFTLNTNLNKRVFSPCDINGNSVHKPSNDQLFHYFLKIYDCLLQCYKREDVE